MITLSEIYLFKVSSKSIPDADPNKTRISKKILTNSLQKNQFENIISSGETTKGVPNAEEDARWNENFTAIGDADEESKCEEASTK